MKSKSVFIIILFSLITISIVCGVANAYWIWTPETKKFTNPKYAVKDSPKEQFDWAMSFYDAKDYQRAATEFEKLAKQYEFAESASKAQYYVGLCYENMNKYYIAYQNYQKAIDNFPHVENTEEILAREFAIANLYLSKPSPKVMGADIMAPLDRAVEIFKKVVENAPYGKFAEESQFKLGVALKKSERYEEAVQAFHKVVEDYPKSKLVTQAMYEESDCAYRASLKPAYDAAATNNAIKTFEKFSYKNKDTDLAKNADVTIKRLKDNVAEKSYRAAEFYESQGKTQAAIIYYQDVIDTYPDSSFASKSKDKIEALKAKASNAGKKKSENVASEKKPWQLFKFEKKAPQKKPKDAVEAGTKKKSWNLFGFMKKKDSLETKDQAAPEKETPKKQAWNPFGFMKKNQKEAESSTKEEPKKSPWNLFGLGKKNIETKDQAAKENVKPKKSLWNPFNIGLFKKEQSSDKPAEKKPWKPLSFESPKKEIIEEEEEEEESPEKAIVEAKPQEAPATNEIPAAQKKEEPLAQTTTESQNKEITKTIDTKEERPVEASLETKPVEDKKTEIKEPLPEEAITKSQNENDAVKVDNVTAPINETPKSDKKWKPFNFENRKEPVVKEEAAIEKPKKSQWNPLNIGLFKKDAAKADKPSEKKQWKPLNFGSSKKEITKEEEAAEATAVQESSPKAEPVSNEVKNEQSKEDVVAQSTAIDTKNANTDITETAQKESSKTSTWKPFNFENNKKPKQEQKSKAWKPLYFGTNDNAMAATDRRW